MKEVKKDRSLVRDAIGDPAFYNDQIGKNKEPVKANMESKKKTDYKRQ